MVPGAEINQRNHRVPQNIRHPGKHRPRRMDHTRHGSYFPYQLGRRHRVPAGFAHRRLRHPQVPRLPPPLLQLQKMHLRHGQTSSTLLRQTQPQRLQTHLPPTHRPFLLCASRAAPSGHPARIYPASIHASQGGGSVFPHRVFGVQCVNLAHPRQAPATFCLVKKT